MTNYNDYLDADESKDENIGRKSYISNTKRDIDLAYKYWKTLDGVKKFRYSHIDFKNWIKVNRMKNDPVEMAYYQHTNGTKVFLSHCSSLENYYVEDSNLATANKNAYSIDNSFYHPDRLEKIEKQLEETTKIIYCLNKNKARFMTFDCPVKLVKFYREHEDDFLTDYTQPRSYKHRLASVVIDYL